MRDLTLESELDPPQNGQNEERNTPPPLGVTGRGGRGWVAGGWWLVVGGWWLVAGGCWLVLAGWVRNIGFDDDNGLHPFHGDQDMQIHGWK